jgi:hypothetical protein
VIANPRRRASGTAQTGFRPADVARTRSPDGSHHRGIDEIRERLGDSNNVRGAVTPILREGARVGTEFARLHAPRGSTGRLAGAIEDDAIVFRIRGDVVAARFGLQPVRDPGRGSRLYPIYVHEGTGLYGRLHRVITAKRSPVMVFPGGGKPWPVTIGRTGAS